MSPEEELRLIESYLPNGGIGGSVSDRVRYFVAVAQGLQARLDAAGLKYSDVGQCAASSHASWSRRLHRAGRLLREAGVDPKLIRDIERGEDP